ncbi:acyltransferase domain-containing protein [Labedaea rhizosphaerae]|uniref:Acyl transferase family protein n=1 Tax=Labedaea rhizosphaerae TaxID=598644 RepID=A0A4R6S0J2_LABRH|nr:acyltransferase domain-containing protein [Labedaea rhizosphaerae]TDP92960.1 acyl transferase family protein [Labedaea rhizosphaerae]
MNVSSHPEQVVFLFPGVGDHYAGMGKGLYDTEPVFRSTVDHCAAVLEPELGQDIRTVLYPAGAVSAPGKGKLDLAALMRGARGQAEIDRTRIAQPLVFTVEYALAQLLISWGITPSGMLGYSLGEYVAACLSGVFSLDDALRLVARRAELIETMPPGGMLVVMLGPDEVAARLDDELSLAAVTSELLSVVAGPVPALERLETTLTAAGVGTLRSNTRQAFHSWMMAPAGDRLATLLGDFELGAPRIPFLSNVTGTWITPEQARDPRYWARQLHQTVRCHDSLGEMWRLPGAVALEVGAGSMLGSLAAQHPARPAGGRPPVHATIPGAGRAGEDVAAVRATAETLGAALAVHSGRA